MRRFIFRRGFRVEAVAERVAILKLLSQVITLELKRPSSDFPRIHILVTTWAHQLTRDFREASCFNQQYVLASVRFVKTDRPSVQVVSWTIEVINSWTWLLCAVDVRWMLVFLLTSCKIILSNYFIKVLDLLHDNQQSIICLSFSHWNLEWNLKKWLLFDAHFYQF